jgi:hypothetical protein
VAATTADLRFCDGCRRLRRVGDCVQAVEEALNLDVEEQRKHLQHSRCVRIYSLCYHGRTCLRTNKRMHTDADIHST